ncbi:hypothetical protein EON68_04725, partial [archaeon]
MQVFWRDVRRLRLPLWLRSAALLRDVVERVARTQYVASNKDPFTAMLPYLMLGMDKLPVVRNIFRLAAGQQKVYSFLLNDFSIDRCVHRALPQHAFHICCMACVRIVLALAPLLVL